MKVLFFFDLKRSSTEEQFKIVFPDKLNFTKIIIQIFGLVTKLNVRLKMTIERADTKTNQQLGYYYSEVLIKCLIAYQILGWKEVQNIDDCDYLLKKHAGFVKELVNETTGEVQEIIKSKARFKIDEMSHLIDFAITEVCGTAGINVLTPEDFFKQNK